ncbi:MAG: class I SAM-dependent RNA methyltransferase [Pseudomonadota bacterium]
MDAPLDLFLTAPPGLEAVLRDEALALGFGTPEALPGGVRIDGGWPEVWRANLTLRGATRVLARIARFRALHLAQLDKRARRVPWREVLPPALPVRVEAACVRSRIYHAGAARQRIERALREEAGLTIATEASDDAHTRILARIDDDLCTISVDTSGAPLHRRGTKQAVGKAPLRDTLAALLLREAGYDGREPLVDPMCGSGTFVLEAAAMACGQAPGLHRSFAFETFPSFDAEVWHRMRPPVTEAPGPVRAWGFDRDQGAIAAASANSGRAHLAHATAFARQPISELRPPVATPGLLIANPPYGVRIGKKTPLRALYASFGETLLQHFSGWRVAFVTSEPALARVTGLPLRPPGPPIPNGGLKIRLYQAGPLP